MTKREAKIKALQMIGGSYLVLSEDLECLFSDKDAVKVRDAIDEICHSLTQRAKDLKNK